MDRKLFGTLQLPVKDLHYTGTITSDINVKVDNSTRTISAFLTPELLSKLSANLSQVYDTLVTKLDKSDAETEQRINELSSEINSDLIQLNMQLSSTISEETQQRENQYLELDAQLKKLNNDLLLATEQFISSDAQLTEAIQNVQLELNEHIAKQIAGIEQKITDLTSDITELQKSDASLNEKIEDVKKSIPSIPENVSAFTNDKKYQTEDDVKSAITGKADRGTTLAEYRILDAYTSLVTDAKLGEKANKSDVYEKSETYTKSEVNNAIAGITSFTAKVVTDTSEVVESGILYLIKKPETSGDDIYQEYLFIDNKATLIGDTSVDLSGYLTEEAAKTELDKKADKNDTYTKAEIDDLLNPLKFSKAVVHSPSIVAKGNSYDITSTWSLNKEPKGSVSCEPSDGDLQKSGTTYTYAWEASEGTNTLKVSVDNISSSKAVTFTYYVYYGADIETVSNFNNLIPKLSPTSAIGNVTVDIGENKYFWYAIPVKEDYKQPVFKVGGFEGGVSEISISPAITVMYGDEEVEYKFYRSTQPNLGLTTFNIS